MINLYRTVEKIFEKLTAAATVVLGNSITFIIALSTVIYWLTNKQYNAQNFQESVRDIILSVTFLSFFIIQKSFNRFSALLHFKINELIASHEHANNAVIDAEDKTEHEINKLSKEHIADKIKEAGENS
ncbi:low affinity iron permease family protein [Ferruginibacter sp.]